MLYNLFSLISNLESFLSEVSQIYCIIGIISSLFCAIFITRLVFDRWLGKGKEIPFGNKMTVHAFKNFKIDFVGKRKYYYIFSALIIIGGIFSYVKKDGFSLGVDFKGGRSYIVRFDNIKSTEEVRNALEVSFGEAPEVKTYGEGGSQVRVTTTYLIDSASEPDNLIILLISSKYLVII